MAQFGKAIRSGKGKPSYFMAILGVAIVLFIWGLLGLIAIYLNTFRKNLSQNVKVHIYLTNTTTKPEIDSFISYLKAQPYTREVEFTDKEKAKQIMIGSKGEEVDFGVIDEMNPLPNTVTIGLKSEYMQPDTVTAITARLQENRALIDSLDYSKDVVEAINKSVKNIKIVLLIAAILLSLLVVLLIDNTIKLAMYSNRFLIKTMQMVGATRWFIAKPLIIRAVINGLISAGVTLVVLYGVILLAEAKVPDIRPFRDMPRIIMLFSGIILLGAMITVASTYRSVIKYLRMKLDDLY